MHRNMTRFGLALAVAIAIGGFAGCGGGTSHASGKILRAMKPEPEVAFKDFQGKSVPLASLKGKVVLVNFWATWCDPCRAEIPSLIQAQQKYQGHGFTLLGVAMDDDGTKVVQPFVQKTTFDVDGHPETMNYPIVIGDDASADKFGGLWEYPVSFLITRDGKIAKKYIGMVDENDLDHQIEMLLGS